MRGTVKIGDRVRVTGQMNDPAPLPVGAEGEINWLNLDYDQIGVVWDPPHQRRTLMLLVGDPFEVMES